MTRGKVKTSWNKAGDIYIIVNNDSPVPGQAHAILQPKEARELIADIETAITKAGTMNTKATKEQTAM